MKIHIRRVASDRITLCKIWAGPNSVSKELMGQQADGTLCKVCSFIAARVGPEKPKGARPVFSVQALRG